MPVDKTKAAPFPPQPFPLFQGESAPPQSSHENAMKKIGSEEDQYTEYGGAIETCARVLCYNPATGDPARRERIYKSRQKFSFIGKYGHLERASAWTHLIGGLIFFVFATARPAFGLDLQSTAGYLSAVTSVVLMLTFFVSTAYHSLGTIQVFMPILRTADHGIIYVALGAAAVTDAAVTTIDFLNVPWQTRVDGVIVAFLLIVFFSYRRLVLPTSETLVAWGECKFGLFRLQHADMEHSSLRSAGYVTLSFCFVLLIPNAVQNLPYSQAVMLIVVNAVSLTLLVAGLLLDNVLVWPDRLYDKGIIPATCVCHSKTGGCVLNSHAIWHIMSLLSVLILTVGREAVIAATLEGRVGSQSWPL